MKLHSCTEPDDAASAPVNQARRNLFRKLAQGEDPNAPHRAPWHKVIGVPAGECDVLWSGWATAHEVFVVGDEGLILHFDGSTDTEGRLWHPMTSQTRLPLHAIWGRNRNELHAVGWMGTVVSFDGQQWHPRRGGVVDQQSQRFVSCVENTPLFAITGDKAGRAWAVGDNGTILGFDGHDWRPQTSPTHANLRGITCAPGDQLFAVGGEGTVITSRGDGHWEQLDCPYGASFNAVLALSDDQLLLAGGRYVVDAAGFRGELVRWHDGRFSAVEVAKSMPRLRSLRAYKAGVLIAGDQGHLYYLEGNRLDQLRTDSRHDLMQIVPLPTGEALAVGDFSTIMTAAPDFVKALVLAESDTALDPDWDGMESGTHHNLWGLWSGAGGVVYACGDAGTVLQCRNDRWQTLPAASDLAVHCLWDAGDGGLYAGGQAGQIFQYDRCAWHKVFDLDLDLTILAIWGCSPSSIYAVGDEGLILHWDGVEWTRMISGTKSALYSIWGLDDAHVLVVGDFGLVLRWNGENWAEFYVGSENFLFDVWGDTLDNIFIVGLSGTLAHFDGKRWTLTPTRARDDLMAVDGITGHGPWAVGTLGNILRFDGEKWQPELSSTTAGLRAVCVCPDGNVYAAGDQGTVLKRRSTSKVA
ncbi:MAG: glycosyl hydrolase [Candidimonas sp.]|nr:MAG: glycosyl hydrolase [Candidimonas sp.]TAM21906.1 MAG: glycosyl hydrolase [Candidimonas sp.]